MWRSLSVIVVVMMGVVADGSQGPALNTVMREKLRHAQKILEAVVTSDWSSLETHSRELERLTNDPRWMILKYPEYARHSAAFVRAVQALHTAAAQRDLEETPKAYIDVTLQCVECHRYLARERIAK
jgi:cytochrome c556